MILIVESGSTKSNWVLIQDSQVLLKFNSEGLNPVFNDLQSLNRIIINSIPDELDIKRIDKVYFYGAGCMHYENSELILDSLNSIFLNSKVIVNSDIKAAAVSLFKDKPGIAVILGTGSNICLYDGKDIILTRSGLGFILGDEGSGAHLGKLLITSYLNGFLPKDLSAVLEKEHNLSKSGIIDSVYKQENPNLYLSKFSVFIKKNYSDPFMKEMIMDSFKEVFNLHITQIQNYRNLNIGFVGSIAYNYIDILKEVALEFEIEIEKIIEKPIDGLIDYHVLSIK